MTLKHQDNLTSLLYPNLVTTGYHQVISQPRPLFDTTYGIPMGT